MLVWDAKFQVQRRQAYTQEDAPLFRPIQSQNLAKQFITARMSLLDLIETSYLALERFLERGQLPKLDDTATTSCTGDGIVLMDDRHNPCEAYSDRDWARYRTNPPEGVDLCFNRYNAHQLLRKLGFEKVALHPSLLIYFKLYSLIHFAYCMFDCYVLHCNYKMLSSFANKS